MTGKRNEMTAKKKYFYEVEYGYQKGEHLVKTVFAEDDLGAIDLMYGIYPQVMIWDVRRISR